jgi:hypothetical protein
VIGVELGAVIELLQRGVAGIGRVTFGVGADVLRGTVPPAQLADPEPSTHELVAVIGRLAVGTLVFVHGCLAVGTLSAILGRLAVRGMVVSWVLIAVRRMATWPGERTARPGP